MNDNAEVTHDMKMVYLQILPFLLKRQSFQNCQTEILNNYTTFLPFSPKKNPDYALEDKNPRNRTSFTRA